MKKKMKHNKKGIIQFGIIAIALAVIVVGFLAFNPFKVKGIPSPPPDMTNREKIESCPSGFLQDNNGNCIQQIINIPCSSGQARDNNNVCVDIGCPSGMIKNSAGTCVRQEFTSDPKLSNCVPNVAIKNMWVRTKNKVGTSNKLALIAYDLIIRNDCETNLYLEVGIDPKRLAIEIRNPSACDGNVHYAGQWIRGSKNTIFHANRPAGEVAVAFYPHDYGIEGSYNAGGGVYTGCFKDGGTALQEAFTAISIKNSYSDNDESLSWMRVIDNFNRVS